MQLTSLCAAAADASLLLLWLLLLLQVPFESYYISRAFCTDPANASGDKAHLASSEHCGSPRMMVVQSEA